MKNILIIGAKGFIGSYAVEYFKHMGYDVWSCDIITDYETEQYIQIDASNSNFNEVFEKRNFDICINCSGAASVQDSLVHPYRDFLLNTNNVFSMLNAIYLHNPFCKFINLSSAAVYGNNNVLPISESLHTCPVSPYGRHKLMSEEILKEFSDDFGLKTCSLRIFSAYGAGLRKQLFWDMNKKMTAANEAIFWGTGEESRDFIHVKDIVRVVELCINNANFDGTPINVANGTQIKIREAVDLFAKLKGYTGKITFNGIVRDGDPNFWEADIKIIKQWGYKPTVEFEQGLSDYILWAGKELV